MEELAELQSFRSDMHVHESMYDMVWNFEYVWYNYMPTGKVEQNPKEYVIYDFETNELPDYSRWSNKTVKGIK